jgi:hypothetical protein
VRELTKMDIEEVQPLSALNAASLFYLKKPDSAPTVEHGYL